MDKNELDSKISEVTKTMFSFCMSRTGDREEAEDLSQDILLEIIKSADNIRDDKAFYGFMWSIAGNVYKGWLKKKTTSKNCELDDNIPDNSLSVESMNEILEANYKVSVLRRELCLLTAKYRVATIKYYVESKSCSEISKDLQISESMVKYLLFKARKILKEGINMNRLYGEQSYNPKTLTLSFLGNKNNFYKLCEKKIPQNILMACYNDSLSQEGISLQIGVPLPYIEGEIKILLEHGVLLKKGEKYSTNVVIFTSEFAKEVNIKAEPFQKEIAKLVGEFITSNEKRIRDIGFYGSDMSHNTYMWQMMCLTLYRGIVNKLRDKIEAQAPRTIFGDNAFVWGIEDPGSEWEFGICNLRGKNDDAIQFMDFSKIGELKHTYFFNYKHRTDIYLDVASGKVDKFSEYDMEIIADLIQNGYVLNSKGKFSVTVPVYTKVQYDKLILIIDEIAVKVCETATALLDLIKTILCNHTPVHLKEQSKGIAWLRLFEDAISAPVEIMHREGYIKDIGNTTELPTTYIRLAE